MSKNWWEETPEEFVAGFSEEVQIRHTSDFHPDFGLLYKFSDFKKGEHVSYRVVGDMRQGEIIWVSTGDKKVPPHYWILPDGTGDSFPDMVLFSDIVMV
jgi:hypothetical protein